MMKPGIFSLASIMMARLFTSVPPETNLYPETNEKIIKSFYDASREPHGMGNLLELALLSSEFYPRSYAPGSRLKLFKRVQLVAEGKSNVQAQDQEHKRIREEVEVVNVEVPVRVFYKNRPVRNLKKKDFKLFLDGEEWDIHGFYEVRKKLKLQSIGQAPRFFVLVFNVSSPVGSDLERAMQVFFTQVIRPKDRLMVLTNNIFLKDHPVEDPGQEMKKLNKILNIESKKI